MKPILAASLFAILGIAAVGQAMADGTHDHDLAGVPGTAAEAKRSITVTMTDDMRFSPSAIRVKQGETIRFAIKNSGVIRHEFAIGRQEELLKHYELMKKHPDMEHSDANMITLDSGESGEVIWKFSKAGVVNFACLQPGHYDAGMKGQFQVARSTLK